MAVYFRGPLRRPIFEQGLQFPDIFLPFIVEILCSSPHYRDICHSVLQPCTAIYAERAAWFGAREWFSLLDSLAKDAISNDYHSTSKLKIKISPPLWLKRALFRKKRNRQDTFSFSSFIKIQWQINAYSFLEMYGSKLSHLSIEGLLVLIQSACFCSALGILGGPIKWFAPVTS